MNTEPLNGAPLISAVRSNIIKVVIGLALGVIGTVAGRVIRRSHITQPVGVTGAVTGRAVRRSRISQLVGVIGSVIGRRRQITRGTIASVLGVQGTVSGRIVRRGKIAGTVGVLGGVSGIVRHRVRADPISLLLGISGSVAGVDIPTGPASADGTFFVFASSDFEFTVPGDQSSLEVT